MAHMVETGTVESSEIAAVRCRLRVGEVSSSWRPALDQVWDFLRRHEGLRTDGHNIFVYRPLPDEGLMDVDFGVQVTRPFDGEGNVTCTTTPAGLVATTVHVGPYDQLEQAYAAIRSWATEHGRTLGAVAWELYGDWTDDPALLTTQLFHTLRP